MNKRQRQELEAARNMEADCTLGAGRHSKIDLIRLRELCNAVAGFKSPSLEETRLAGDLSSCLDEIELLRAGLIEACDCARHFANVAGHPDDAVAIAVTARVAELRKLV